MKINLTLERLNRTDMYTEGKLYLNGVYLCDTLEPYDCCFTQNITANIIEEEKKLHKICIPSGKYKVILNYSARFRKVLPLLVGVKGFTGIRIHSGNSVENTEGCILVGKKTRDGWVSNSRNCTNNLIEKIKGNNCDISIQISYGEN